MTAFRLKITFDDMQNRGLNVTIRARAENAILYRKWGDLGEWGKHRINIQNYCRKHQPEFLSELSRVFNEA